jgi:thiamine-monophosphate kinase
MELKELGEFGLIDRISKSIRSYGPNVVVGLGDDAAIIVPRKGMLLVATTDMMVEGVHFDLSYTSFFSLGWKAMCSNISDCAAMGGSPKQALISLGVPGTTALDDIDELYEGIHSLAKKFGVDVIGGDTVSSPKAVVLNIALLGEVSRSEMLLRSAARPGDVILMTGDAGSSAAGLDALKKKKRGRLHPEYVSLMRSHLMPEPGVEEARIIARSRSVNAMIDNSDGIARCVDEICRMSRVGAEIFVDSIPVSVATVLYAGSVGKSALDYALYGGEDYGLVFTAPRSKADMIAKKVKSSTGTAVTEIGRIIKSPAEICQIGRTGKRTALKNKGFDHFRRGK